jgi:hypothetical protein
MPFRSPLHRLETGRGVQAVLLAPRAMHPAKW